MNRVQRGGSSVATMHNSSSSSAGQRKVLGVPVDPNHWDAFWRSYRSSFKPTGTLRAFVAAITRAHYPQHHAWETGTAVGAGRAGDARATAVLARRTGASAGSGHVTYEIAAAASAWGAREAASEALHVKSCRQNGHRGALLAATSVQGH
jgi:hypothetical protein